MSVENRARMAYFTEPMAEEIRKALGEVEKKERKKKTASTKKKQKKD